MDVANVLGTTYSVLTYPFHLHTRRDMTPHCLEKKRLGRNGGQNSTRSALRREIFVFLG